MKWATLLLLELAVFVVIAGGSHLWMFRLRHAFVEGLANRAAVAKDLATLSDLIAMLVYVAFAAVMVSFDGGRPVGTFHIEAVLDTIGVFALLVALVQVASIFILNRLTHHLEPWPPKPVEGAAK